MFVFLLIWFTLPFCLLLRIWLDLAHELIKASLNYTKKMFSGFEEKPWVVSGFLLIGINMVLNVFPFCYVRLQHCLRTLTIARFDVYHTKSRLRDIYLGFLIADSIFIEYTEQTVVQVFRIIIPMLLIMFFSLSSDKQFLHFHTTPPCRKTIYLLHPSPYNKTRKMFRSFLKMNYLNIDWHLCAYLSEAESAKTRIFVYRWLQQGCFRHNRGYTWLWLC